MGFGHVDWLPREDHDRVRIVGGERVMRKMRVEIESRYPRQPTSPVEVPHRNQWHDLFTVRRLRGTKAPAVFNWNTKPFHQRARIPAKTLLARDERIPMM